MLQLHAVNQRVRCLVAVFEPRCCFGSLTKHVQSLVNLMLPDLRIFGRLFLSEIFEETIFRSVVSLDNSALS